MCMYSTLKRHIPYSVEVVGLAHRGSGIVSLSVLCTGADV